MLQFLPNYNVLRIIIAPYMCKHNLFGKFNYSKDYWNATHVFIINKCLVPPGIKNNVYCIITILIPVLSLSVF